MPETVASWLATYLTSKNSERRRYSIKEYIKKCICPSHVNPLQVDSEPWEKDTKLRRKHFIDIIRSCGVYGKSCYVFLAAAPPCQANVNGRVSCVYNIDATYVTSSAVDAFASMCWIENGRKKETFRYQALESIADFFLNPVALKLWLFRVHLCRLFAPSNVTMHCDASNTQQISTTHLRGQVSVKEASYPMTEFVIQHFLFWEISQVTVVFCFSKISPTCNQSRLMVHSAAGSRFATCCLSVFQRAAVIFTRIKSWVF